MNIRILEVAQPELDEAAALQREAGFAGHLKKPFGEAAIVATVGSVLGAG